MAPKRAGFVIKCIQWRVADIPDLTGTSAGIRARAGDSEIRHEQKRTVVQMMQV